MIRAMLRKLTSVLKSSSGNPSTAFMLSCEPGWTTAKPPDTVNPVSTLVIAPASNCAGIGIPSHIRSSPKPPRITTGISKPYHIHCFSSTENWEGHIRKKCLLPPLSSIISTKPGFSCSIEGTWLARTPISPDSAGMFTCTLDRRLVSIRCHG